MERPQTPMNPKDSHYHNVRGMGAMAFQSLLMTVGPLYFRAAAVAQSNPTAAKLITTREGFSLHMELYGVANDLHNIGVVGLNESHQENELAIKALKEIQPPLSDADRRDLTKQMHWMMGNAERVMRVLSPEMPWDILKNTLLPPGTLPPKDMIAPPDTESNN